MATIGLTVSGRENFVEFKRKDKAGRPNIYRRHWNGSLLLEKTDERTVRGRCYLLAFNGAPRSRALVTPAISNCFADAGMITFSIIGGYVLSQCG